MEGRRAGGRRRGEGRRRCGRRYAGEEEDGAGEEDNSADRGTRPPLPEMAGRHQPATSGRPRRGGPGRGELLSGFCRSFLGTSTENPKIDLSSSSLNI